MAVMPFTPAIAPATRPTARELLDLTGELLELGVGDTDFVPKGLRGNPAAIVAAVLYGREVGLELMQSIQAIAVIDGKPTVSAEAQRALIQQAGHEIWPEDVTTTHATMVGRRRGEKQTTRVTWTLDDAKRARIAGKPAWQLYPRAMLIARASAELARQVFADVIHGMAATEEFDELPGAAAAEDVAEPPAPRTPSSRRQRTRRLPAGTSTPPPASEPQDEPPPPEPAAPEPEPDPAPEPEQVPPDPPSDNAIKRLFATFNDKGYTDRDARLAYSERVLGRAISSSTELSAVDVSQIIDALNAEPAPKPAKPPTEFKSPAGATLPEAEQQVADDLEAELDARPALDDDGFERPPLPDDEP